MMAHSPILSLSLFKQAAIVCAVSFSVNIRREQKKYNMVWSLGESLVDLSNISDLTLPAQTFTIPEGPHASSILYVYSILAPSNTIIIGTSLNPNPDIHRLLCAVNYSVLTGAPNWERVVNWDGGPEGRITFNLLPSLNYSSAATPLSPPPPLHELPLLWCGAVDWLSLLSESDIIDLLLAVTGGCSVVAISEDANRAAFFVHALSHVILPLEAKPLVSRASPKELATLLEFGGGFIVGYEGEKGFELVDMDAMIIDLDRGTMKTPKIYRSRVPPPAIARAAFNGHKVGGPREAFIRILAEACESMESCLSWTGENEVELDEKKLIIALGESEWATYFVGGSPFLELFERIIWRGEDGGLLSWVKALAEPSEARLEDRLDRGHNPSPILIIDTSEPKDEDISWPSSPPSLTAAPRLSYNSPPSSESNTNVSPTDSSCPLQAPKLQFQNVIHSYLLNSLYDPKITVYDAFSAWGRAVEKSSDMLDVLLRKIEDSDVDCSARLETILPSTISHRDLLLLGTWRRVLSNCRLKPSAPPSPPPQPPDLPNPSTIIIWSRTTACVDCHSVFTNEEIMSSWTSPQLPCFLCGTSNFVEPRLGYKVFTAEALSETEPTSTYLTKDLTEVEGAIYVPFLPPTLLFKRLQERSSDPEIKINIQYWSSRLRLSPGAPLTSIFSGWDYNLVLSSSLPSGPSLLLQHDWTSPITSPILCSLLTPPSNLTTHPYTTVLLLLLHHKNHNALRKINKFIIVCEGYHTWCMGERTSELERTWEIGGKGVERRVAYRSVFNF
ncbi:hypothetical protein TrVE_jg10016 [Triparma verrucosa]|uniref:UDENN domain-containing protein n=1 Tax=Triparma verrucosa TaxID=1606542 RepID=A0A9W7FMD8_9STRA|nr:hypothetical protein TrVE_jg10016 [Triparma verrucosa]